MFYMFIINIMSRWWDIIMPEIPRSSQFHEVASDNVDSKEYLSFLLHLMTEYEASDIYLTYWEVPVLRIDQSALRVSGASVLDDKILDDFKDILLEGKNLLDGDKSVDLWYSIHGRRYRINVSLQRWHVMIVARLLAEKIPTIDELWLPPILKSLAHKSWWMVFLSGPTWSWKSTTLAAMIEELNQTCYKHIITIEDPIEYIFQPKMCVFEQKQLWTDVTSFATAMKYAVRQRPDVILFWEIRDAESLRYAMSLAETWHLVLTTIHSRSAEQAINRIISMVPMDEQAQMTNQLSENMVWIIIQKLIKRKKWWVVAIHEILLNNVSVANTIRENKLHQINNVIFSNKKIWMQLMDDSLIKFIASWDITIETALENTHDPLYIRRWLETLWFKID